MSDIEILRGIAIWGARHIAARDDLSRHVHPPDPSRRISCHEFERLHGFGHH